MDLQEHQLKSLKGLSEPEVADRRLRFGWNELPQAGNKRLFRILVEVVSEPMFMLLLACFGIYLILGDRTEAFMLLGFVAISIVITIYQENKTERSLEALRDLSSPRALVIRNGERQRIPGREVVPDDLIFLNEGDRVPADGELLWCLNLRIDESVLTGESVAVTKKAATTAAEKPRPGGEQTPFVFSSSLVVAGQGIARVLNTGIHTEVGKIGKALHQVAEEKSPLQRETQRLVKRLTIVGLSLSVVLTISYGLIKGLWLQGLLAGITLAMGLLPEEFPVILTVFLALGAWRISRHRVLTRKAGAIETLGAVTTLCVDKTGTLTENKMAVRCLAIPAREAEKAVAIANSQLFDLKERITLPEEFHELIEFAVLASKRDPFDPMEKALQELIDRKAVDEIHHHPERKLQREYPLANSLLVLSYAWRLHESDRHIVGAKGAPEAVAEVCRFTKHEKDELVEQVEKLTTQGWRVLGVAKATTSQLPEQQTQFDFEFLGLIAWEDPIRPSVPPAVKECYEAGIEVKMITGDYAGTARSIATQAGLLERPVILGTDLENLPAEDLTRAVHESNVFARMVPEQKLKLVRALQAQGEIVGMTGDGVNDAPSLKAAHVGIAMGGRGTDVAREAAHLVLLEDDFSHIVAAVRLGRRIYDNLRKAMAYVVAIHVPIAGLSIIPILLGWPMALFPAHILFLEMIVDPACSLVFEQEEAEHGAMKRAPRKSGASLFSRSVVMLSVLQGLAVLALTLITYGVALHNGLPADEARSLTFATLIVANVALILSNRQWEKSIFATFRQRNKAAAWIIAGAIVLLLCIYSFPWLSRLFQFGPMHLHDFGMAIGLGLLSLLWFEWVKWFTRRRGASYARW